MSVHRNVDLPAECTLYSTFTLVYLQVDRSVTGLVAQQQCVGPLHTPLADVAVLAQSHFATTGIATAVGTKQNSSLCVLQ